jgi:hypothetical protein
MTYLNLRYKPTELENQVLEEILLEYPFFESKELFKFLLGFYVKKNPKMSNFRAKRLAKVAKSFEIKSDQQIDDNLIKKSVKLKPLVF